MWRALGLVVVLTAAGPAVAQPVAAPPAGPAGEDTAHQTEIRVELAWLADPLICPYYPCARVAGGALVIGGHVPDDSVRARVLEAAREHCGLPLLDRLKVRPGLAVPRLNVPAEKLQRAALLTARAEAAAGAERLQVTCSPAGLITLTGAAGSFEDKLHVSECLRRLPGCAAVVNLLQVADNAGGQPAPQVAGGPELVPVPDLPPPPPSAKTPTASAVDAGPTIAIPVPELPAAEPIMLVAQPTAAPAPTAAPPAAPHEGPAGAAPAAPLVTEDFVTLPAPEEDEPPIKLVPDQLQTQLVQRIREACPEAQNVAVVVTPPRGVLVRLRVRNPDEGERLAARVRTLPQTAFLSVAFDLQVGR